MEAFPDLNDLTLQRAKMEALGTLAGGVAHDLRNLLCPIIGHAELAMFSLGKDAEARSHLEKILAAARKSEELLTLILGFCKPETGDLRPLRPQTVLREGLVFLRSSIPDNIEIRCHLDDECGPVGVDPGHIHLMLVNLCANAWHAVGRDGGTIDVALFEEGPASRGEPGATGRGDSWVKLVVKDDGPGIPEEIRHRIFDPYFTTKDSGRGSGLGLFIVRRIVETAGGTIQVISAPHQGTTVEIALPKAAERGHAMECTVDGIIPRASRE